MTFQCCLSHCATVMQHYLVCVFEAAAAQMLPGESSRARFQSTASLFAPSSSACSCRQTSLDRPGRQRRRDGAPWLIGGESSCMLPNCSPAAAWQQQLLLHLLLLLKQQMYNKNPKLENCCRKVDVLVSRPHMWKSTVFKQVLEKGQGRRQHRRESSEQHLRNGQMF